VWQFDANGLPTALELPDAQAFAFLHDSLGREIARQLPNGARTEQDFDPVGRLTSQQTRLAGREGRLLQERRTHYTADGLPGHIDDSLRGSTQYSFSPTGQVLQSTSLGKQNASLQGQYAYDLAGKLLEAIHYNAKGECEVQPTTQRQALERQVLLNMMEWLQDIRLTLDGEVRRKDR